MTTSLNRDLPEVYGTGEILKDEKVDWRKEKLRSSAVSVVMPQEKRSDRIAECSTLLKFAADNLGNKRLAYANFCKDRMCPSCSRRRSLKVFHDLKGVCAAMLAERPSVRFLMLTLTVPNVHSSELSSTISHILQSWNRLTKRKEFDLAVLGWFRSLEVTREKSDRKDYYHPHIHALIAVPAHYFKTGIYLKQSRWLELWQEATRQPEITQVDIRPVKSGRKKTAAGSSELNDQGGSSLDAVASGAAEVGKYATKPSEYIASMPDGDYIADSEPVAVLSEALKGKRLIAYGKRFKELLGASDVESDDVDLVHVSENASDIDPVMIEVYRWFGKNKNYIG